MSDVRGIWDANSAIKSDAPLEQVQTTHDKTDYLWYRVSLPRNPGNHMLETNANDVAYFYVNGSLQAFVRSGNPAHVTLQLPQGAVDLDILSLTDGLQNYGAHYERITRGIAGGSVKLDGSDITRPSGGWTHQVGLKGESLQLWKDPDTHTWNKNVQAGLNAPLTWWYATFATPEGNEPLALDMTGLGKGYAYVNGHGIGRYWNITAGGGCPACSEIQGKCDYRGNYNPGKCSCDCGVPSQRYYHVPRDWLAASGGSNKLVLIEEMGAYDLSKVNIAVHM